jgi:hypothetical protein
LLSFNHPNILLSVQEAALWNDGLTGGKWLKINNKKVCIFCAFCPEVGSGRLSGADAFVVKMPHSRFGATGAMHADFRRRCCGKSGLSP